MAKYMGKRLVQTLIIMFLVSVISFLLISLMPKDPVYAILGNEVSAEEYARTYHELGLDRPILVRYGRWILDAMHGDFGISYKYNKPVMEIIGMKLGTTVFLSVLATLISFPLGILFGIITAVKRGTATDTVVTLLANLFTGIPQFVTALVFLYIFAMKLRILPAMGFTWPWEDFSMYSRQVVMPLACLSVAGVAGITRQTRSSILEAMGQDYVRTARSKGLKERFIIYKHVMPNGLIPIITMIGQRLATMIGGSMFVESVFSIPGMGSLMVYSIESMDIPMIQAIVLLTSLVISVAYIITDILYVVVDPRISLS